MQIHVVLEILIALAVVYFLFSTLVSIIFEWFCYKVQKRGRFLHQSILKLLNDDRNQSYGALLYTHFAIDKLKKSKDSYPQYISSGLFADAVIDIVGRQSEELIFENDLDENNNVVRVAMKEKRIADPFERFKAGVDKMNYSPLKSQLRSFYEKSADINSLKLAIENWFNDYMARASGWYKNATQKNLFYISLVVALVFNIDSLHIINKLQKDDSLRVNLVMKAEEMVYSNALAKKDSMYSKQYSGELEYLKKMNVFKDSLDNMYIHRTDSILGEIESAGIPIGYQGKFNPNGDKFYWIWWFFGILISAYALSFGAPFWFEVITKVINIRRAGVKH